MEVLTLGFYDKSNHGDETYKDTFKNLFPQHNFTFVNQLNEELINKSEVVLLGGGNVLRKHYINELKKVKNKKIYAYSVGIEEDNINDLHIFEHIYARDYKTIDILKNNNINCTFIPDAALTLSGNPINGTKIINEMFKKNDLDLYSKKIAVIINSYMSHSSSDSLSRDVFNFMKFSYDIAKTIDETPASFIFIPFSTQSPNDDRSSNSWIASKCKFWKKNHVIYDKISYLNALDIIAACDLTISSRLHSSVFSYVTGTNFIDLTHHSKNESFLNVIGKSNNSISYWNFDNRILKNKINELINVQKHKEYEYWNDFIKNETVKIQFNK